MNTNLDPPICPVLSLLDYMLNYILTHKKKKKNVETRVLSFSFEKFFGELHI